MTTNDTTNDGTSLDASASTLTTAPAVGQYVDGWHGQYAGAAMILTATSFGYGADEHGAVVVERARKHYDSMGSSTSDRLTDDEHDALLDDVTDVEQWLNDTVARDGYAFGWNDGDFHYQSVQWWDDESY